jgi:hypothetical protein
MGDQVAEQTTCQVDWDVFGDHVWGDKYAQTPPCDEIHQEVNSLIWETQCALRCADGFTSAMLGESHVIVACASQTGVKTSVRPTGFKGTTWVAPSTLNCKANACIPTANEELAKKDTHIFCTNSNIASGTTGNCKCEVIIQEAEAEVGFLDDDKLRAPQTTTPTTIMAASSGHRIAEFVSAGHMFLVALSTLV